MYDQLRAKVIALIERAEETVHSVRYPKEEKLFKPKEGEYPFDRETLIRAKALEHSHRIFYIIEKVLL
jgi:hypothetical protein